MPQRKTKLSTNWWSQASLSRGEQTKAVYTRESLKSVKSNRMVWNAS